MSERGRLTSRRAFAAGAGVLAAALGAGAVADPGAPTRTDDTGADSASNSAPAPPAAAPPPPAATPPGPPPTPNSPARARDLGKLSNVLYNNPEERALFIADPAAYAVRLGLRYISAADLTWFRAAFADGFCCMGCGC
jgi:hypothetical protein